MPGFKLPGEFVERSARLRQRLPNIEDAIGISSEFSHPLITRCILYDDSRFTIVRQHLGLLAFRQPLQVLCGLATKFSIPLEARKAMGIHPAESEVEFVQDNNGRWYLKKTASRKRGQSRFRKAHTTGKLRMSTDEIMALTRGK